MKYQQSKLIRIKDKNVVGVIHPQVVISGSIKNKNVTLELYIDGELKETTSYNMDKRGKFLFKYDLGKRKKIELYLINSKSNNKVRVLKIYNNIFSRIFYKFRSFFKPFSSIGKGIRFLWREHHFLVPPFLWGKYLKSCIVKFRKLLHLEYLHPFKQRDYLKWIKNCEEQPIYEELDYKPLISILIPVYNIERKYLSECLDSILNQKYENFEVCLADDCSTLEETKNTLEEYKKKDNRIKVIYRTENGHISKTTNSALSIATGEFIALMDDDDVLRENALYEMVYALNKNKDLDFIYSDEDKLDMNGKRCEPHFKPDYSPDSLFGGNYLCHFEIIRKKLVEEVGGEKSEFVGAQDFDLFLRVLEKTVPERVYHISKILYHWRKIPGSTADDIESKDYAIENGKKAVEEALKRRGLNAMVYTPIKSTHYIVEYKYDSEPLVSIIIPTKDMKDTLKRCINSIYENTTYKNYEIIVVNNNSEKEETFEYFKSIESEHNNLRVINIDCEFNFSKINNEAVKVSKGDYLLFLNNDTEVLTPNWISSMVGYAMQSHIGIVGVKLLYPDDTIQHGGVVLGMDGTARHAFLRADADSFGFYGRLLVPYNYSAVTAACMMVSREKFNSVNGYDEELAVAYNDVDLNLKLLKNGYYNVFLPQVELYHYESLSRGLDTTSKKYNQYLKERKILQTKWKEELLHDRFYNPNFSLKYDFMLDRKK